MVEFIERIRRKHLKKYIQHLKNNHTVNKESATYMVQTEGTNVSSTSEDIPFSETRYFNNKENAEEYATAQAALGLLVEIWIMRMRLN